MQRRGFLKSVAALLGVGAIAKSVKAEKPALLDKKDIVDHTIPPPNWDAVPKDIQVSGTYTINVDCANGESYSRLAYFDPVTNKIVGTFSEGRTFIGITK